MKNKLVRAFVSLFAIAVFLIVAFAPATPAEAGTNGQQLTIRANSNGFPGFTELTVSGNNNSNRRATWTWRGGQTYEVSTSGWWWKGNVSVQAKYANGSSRTCSVNVPTVYQSNFFPMECSSTVPNRPPVPATPSNARLGNATTNAMTVYWNDNSNNEQGFKIERRNGGNWSQVATVGAGSTSYTSGGLNAGTQYCFRVRANNSGGDSGYSNEPCANTTTPPPQRPNAPSNARLGNATTNAMTVYWNDNSNNEQGFKIERRNGGSWSQVATVGAGSTSYTSGGLNAGMQYCFRVRANNSGGDSGYSNEPCANTTTPPPQRPNAPSNARLSNVTANSITVQWNDNSNNEQGFKIERRNGGNWSQVATVGAGSTSYTSGGLNAGTQYCFRVRANNSGGDSGYSNEPCVNTSPPPVSELQLARNQLKAMSAMKSPWTQVNAPINNSSSQRDAKRYGLVIEQFDVASADFAGRYKAGGANLSDTRCNIFAGDVMRAMGVPLPTKGNLGTGRNGYPTTDPMTANATELNEFLNGKRQSSDRANSGWRQINPTNADGLRQLIAHVSAGKPVIASNAGHIAVLRPNQSGMTRWQDLRTAQAGAKNFLDDRLEVGFGSGSLPQFFIRD